MHIRNHRFDNIEYIHSPNQSGIITPKFIVMHYTAGYTLDSAVTTLTRKGSKVSAHLTIGLDGTIVQHVDFNKKAWHAGPSRHMGYTGLNSHSIGIEIVNIGWLRPTGPNSFLDAYGNRCSAENFQEGVIASPHSRVGSGTFYWPVYPEAQLRAIDEVTAEIIDNYNILDIITHEEIDTRGWKTDPGPAFPMKRYTQLLSNRSDDDELFEVTASSLNVRGGPGTNFEVTGKLRRGDQVAVIDQDGNWARITDDDWIHMAYLRRI